MGGLRLGLGSGGRRVGPGSGGIRLARADLLPVRRDLGQQADELLTLGGVKRREEGTGRAGQRGRRAVLQVLAARHRDLHRPGPRGPGMNLLLVARSEGELRRLAGKLPTGDMTVAVAAIDPAGRQAAHQVPEAARAELGSVDVLVNNAATEPQTRFHVLTPAEVEDVLQVDLVSPLLLSRLLLPGMLERGYGRIINVSSLAWHTSFPYTEAYAAAKDGLTAFSRVLTGDYRGTGVSATSLILGPVKDGRGHHPDPGRDRPDRQHGLLRRAGEGDRRRAARHR
jgi:NAD(P)-dependent dehydrogenase (short-subunit alcohol dehydrogenase family)